MKYFLLGLGYTENNKIAELIIGTYPWRKERHIKLEDSLEYKDKLENAGITDNFDVVGTSGDLRKYTSYIKETNKITKTSLTVLAKAASHRGEVYFVSDGINNPQWMYIDTIQDHIQKKGVSLSNAKINNTENKLDPIVKDFEEVDFRQSQLEYRRYMKEMKG